MGRVCSTFGKKSVYKVLRGGTGWKTVFSVRLTPHPGKKLLLRNHEEGQDPHRIGAPTKK
jgi:hypothetical protein